MVSSLFKALFAGLSIWQSKDARKYKVKVIKLKKDYYEEYNKERPNMAFLDNVEFELGLIATSFYSEVGNDEP